MDCILNWLYETTTINITAYTVYYQYHSEIRKSTFIFRDTAQEFANILLGVPQLYKNVTIKKVNVQSPYLGLGDPILEKLKID